MNFLRTYWRWLALALFVLAILVYSALYDRAQHDLAKIGDKPYDESVLYKAWWNNAADCLAKSTPYPFRAYPDSMRWYAGSVIPYWWGAEPHKSYGGYTHVATQEVVIFPGDKYNSAVVLHEIWHVRYGEGHPASVFYPPRCGLAAP